jgi:hypothetical protein
MYIVESYPYEGPYGYIVRDNNGIEVIRSERKFVTEKDARNAGDQEVPTGQQIKHGRSEG